MKVSVASLFLALAACGAGSGRFTNEPPRITLSPGGGTTVDFTFEVEGAYEGTWSFSTTSEITGVTSTVSPASADMKEGTPQTATLTINAVSATSGQSGLVRIDAKIADGAHSASNTVHVTIQ